jgi:hypothetical protein
MIINPWVSPGAIYIKALQANWIRGVYNNFITISSKTE